MDGRKNNRGHKGKAGRKPKAEEQKLIERLSPLAPSAFNVLKREIANGEAWAVKLFFQYMYGMPKQVTETTQNIKVENDYATMSTEELLALKAQMNDSE